MYHITSLGSTIVITLITSAVAGFLLLLRKYRHLILFVAAILCGGLMVSLLKIFIDLGRPDLALSPLIQEDTPGFPSGHAFLSAVVYLTIAVMLTGILPRMNMRVYVITLAIVLTGLVGISRIYLGVHYPTDVLAGWSLGFAWACLWWLVIRYFEHRGEQKVH